MEEDAACRGALADIVRLRRWAVADHAPLAVVASTPDADEVCRARGVLVADYVRCVGRVRGVRGAWGGAGSLGVVAGRAGRFWWPRTCHSLRDWGRHR
jgi:hypothetical protein